MENRSISTISGPVEWCNSFPVIQAPRNNFTPDSDVDLAISGMVSDPHTGESVDTSVSSDDFNHIRFRDNINFQLFKLPVVDFITDTDIGLERFHF